MKNQSQLLQAYVYKYLFNSLEKLTIEVKINSKMWKERPKTRFAIKGLNSCRDSKGVESLDQK